MPVNHRSHLKPSGAFELWNCDRDETVEFAVSPASMLEFVINRDYPSIGGGYKGLNEIGAKTSKTGQMARMELRMIFNIVNSGRMKESSPESWFLSSISPEMFN